MSLSSVELWQRITASQLASPVQCRAWAVEAATLLSTSEATDGQRLADTLVRQGKLTQFQADTILSGSDEPLVRNGCRILQPVNFNLPQSFDVRAAWNHWWVAVVPGSAHPMWLRWMNVDDLKQSSIRDSRPSLQYANAHSQIVHENLQSVSRPEKMGTELQLGLSRISGQLLSAACQGNLPIDAIVQMLTECSAGLAALHAAGLVHGRLTPDRICHSETGRWILMRDPLCAFTFNLNNQPRGLLSNKLPSKLLQAHFMAPEFLVPAQVATPQTDIYSLGCTAWLTITGFPPVHNQTPELILASQAEKPLDFTRLGSVPEPITRCLMHCLAKNPEARFRDGRQLHESLIEARRLVAGGTHTPSVDAARKIPNSAASPAASPEMLTSVAQSARKVGPAVRSSVRKTYSKRKNSPWLTAIIGGGALLALLLMLLVVSGTFSFTSSNGSTKSNADDPGKDLHSNNRSTDQYSDQPPDPRAELFELVEDRERVLWAPPRAPDRIPLDLLPPGGQMFAWLRPKQLFNRPQNKQLLSLLDSDVGWLWQWIGDQTGLPADSLDGLVIAAYPGKSGVPQLAIRVHLDQPRSLAQLKNAWKISGETKVGEHAMLSGGPRAYYLSAQPMIDSQSVSDFVVGPPELVREAAEMLGAAGPLTRQLEQLWQSTDRNSDAGCFLSPVFLFTEGRHLMAQSPARLAGLMQIWLSRDLRGAMIMSSLEDHWYYELRLIAANERESGAIIQKASDAIEALPQVIESWFVSQSPHPYWRAIAIRYPNMLRAVASQTRLGVEGGQAIINGYLPSSAASNLLISTWIALQPTATFASNDSLAANPEVAQAPLTIEQILDRKITVVVDQQGIEIVLQLIGEQANEKLPSGTKPLRFELDGSAFQRSGITRNQQIRGFKVESKSVREALTELARRGNPAVGVTDLRAAEQKLIWIILPEADRPGSAIISLTSREAANTAKLALPQEFAPAN